MEREDANPFTSISQYHMTLGMSRGSPHIPPPVSEFLAVRAAAGSGKTFTLTSRFLALLQGAAPEAHCSPACAGASGSGPMDWAAILAVTFTNKAAAEMQERVLTALKERALDIEKSRRKGHPAHAWSPREARRWCETITRRMSRLNIRTIDSLLFQLIRLSALPLGLPPNITPVFDETELFDPLYDRLVDQASKDPALAALLENACRNALEYTGASGFTPALVLKDRLADALSFLLETTSTALVDEDALAARMEDLRLHCVEAATRLAGAIAAENLAAQKHFLNYLAKVQTMGFAQDLPSGVWVDKESLDDCVNKKSKGQASAATGHGFGVLQEALARHAALHPILKDAKGLLPLAQLAQAMLPEYEAIQHRLAKLPKAQWEPLVCGLFAPDTGVSEAYCRLGVRLTHLLIDEFQDTSRNQWEALEPLGVEALSKGGSLFYVGDVKQAIYGWRGGEAALFDELPHREELAGFAEHFRNELLPNNWRSAPVVVDVNNQVFSLLEEEAIAQDVAEAMLSSADASLAPRLAEQIRTSFQHTAQALPSPSRNKCLGLVDVVAVTKEEDGQLEDAVHTAVDAMLDDILARRPYKDVAILVRSNTQAQTVAHWLLDRGVPVVTENSLLLKAHPLVRQIIQCLAFLEFPNDDLAFWEVISGQELFLDASGLAYPELVDWAARMRRDAGNPGPLYLLFARDYPEAWATWLKPFHRQAGIIGPYDCVGELCRRFQLWERRPQDQLFLRRLLEVVHLAESAGWQSLSAFLEYWEDQGDLERAPLPEGLDAVRVITIHKAKGLEFPAVIIPFHHDSDHVDRDLQLVDPEQPQQPPAAGKPGLLVRRRRELGEAYTQTRLRSLMEALHVLYVAWTRAVEELHCVIAPERAASARRSPITSALSVLLPQLGLWPEEGHEEGEPFQVRLGRAPTGSRAAFAAFSRPEDAAPPPPVNAPTPTFRPMEWLPRLRVFRNELIPVNFASRRRGTLLHRCLEHLRLPSPTPSAEERQQAMAAALAAGLRGLANPHDPAAFAQDRESVAEDCLDRLRWLLSRTEVWPWLAWGQREATLLDAQGALHKPDLLVLETSPPLVIEYKTGARAPQHVAQLTRYLALVAAMQPESQPPEGRLIYVDVEAIEPLTFPGVAGNVKGGTP